MLQNPAQPMTQPSETTPPTAPVERPAPMGQEIPLGNQQGNQQGNQSAPAQAKTGQAGKIPGVEKKLLQSPEFYFYLCLLAGVILFGAIAFWFVDRFRKRAIDGEGHRTSGQELTSFRDMLDSGEITHSEYERIREKMANKIKKEVNLKKIPPVKPIGNADKLSENQGEKPKQEPDQSHDNNDV